MTTDLRQLAKRAERKEDRRIPAAQILRNEDFSYWDVAAKAGTSASTVANTLLHGQRNRKVMEAIRFLLADLHLSDDELYGGHVPAS